VRDGSVRSSAASGVLVENGGELNAVRLHFTASGAHGVLLAAGSRASLDDCRADANVGDGIRVDTAEAVTVTDAAAVGGVRPRPVRTGDDPRLRPRLGVAR
jgi:hypothetical protein